MQVAKPIDILKQFWGYNSFRDQQDVIIASILEKKDTLALLPTGGGKSICFQVPALCLEGVCIVISPLIALMNDQVNQLRKRGINAVAISSFLSPKEVDIALDNAIYGNTKFIYVSPERLKTKLFRERFKKMNCSLIAVDEAHCISQWGYDFRPSYTAISEIRPIHPKVPIIALTATATQEVVADIQEKLAFETENVIQKSFLRENLTYSIEGTANKFNRLKELILEQTGSGVIYCSTRKNVKKVCQYLLDLGVKADFYHAGLDPETRTKKQNAWINNETRVIVSTNAFGMGIDKPDVRFVFHMDIPDSIEAYFQEAGRAGRDLQKAEARLLFESLDLKELDEKLANRFPDLSFIKNVYKALGNHYQIAIGSGIGERFDFEILTFCDKYNLELIPTYNALKFLELAEYISLSEDIHLPSRLKVIVNNFELYQIQVRHPKLNSLIQFLLRVYMGLFEDYVKIDEQKIATKLGISIQQVYNGLRELNELQVIEYLPRTNSPQLSYEIERVAEDRLHISPTIYASRKKVIQRQFEAMTGLLQQNSCNQQYILNYFGETNVSPCGRCSACQLLTANVEQKLDLNEFLDFIKSTDETTIGELINRFQHYSREQVLFAIRELTDLKKIEYDPIRQIIRKIS